MLDLKNSVIAMNALMKHTLFGEVPPCPKIWDIYKGLSHESFKDRYDAMGISFHDWDGAPYVKMVYYFQEMFGLQNPYSAISIMESVSDFRHIDNGESTDVVVISDKELIVHMDGDNKITTLSSDARYAITIVPNERRCYFTSIPTIPHMYQPAYVVNIYLLNGMDMLRKDKTIMQKIILEILEFYHNSDVNQRGQERRDYKQEQAHRELKKLRLFSTYGMFATIDGANNWSDSMTDNTKEK